MPHKRPRHKPPPVPDHVRYLRDLGACFGVTDDTLTAWKANGAPGGPPYSIVAWYLWAKGRGYSPRLPEHEQLRSLCLRGSKAAVVVTPGGETLQAAGVSTALLKIGTALGIAPPDEAQIEDEGERVQAWQRWAAACEKAQVVLESDGKLLRADYVERRLREIADVVLEQLAEAYGAALRDIDGLTQEQRGRIRDNLAGWITATRIRFGQKAAVA